MGYIRDKDNILYLESYECDICHKQNLALAAYKLEIEGKIKAVCAECYRQNISSTD